jgi:hypothetical protein
MQVLSSGRYKLELLTHGLQCPQDTYDHIGELDAHQVPTSLWMPCRDSQLQPRRRPRL